nr:MAG TPA: hypothetical protein [Bacteriophage sp.]
MMTNTSPSTSCIFITFILIWFTLFKNFPISKDLSN